MSKAFWILFGHDNRQVEQLAGLDHDGDAGGQLIQIVDDRAKSLLDIDDGQRRAFPIEQ